MAAAANITRRSLLGFGAGSSPPAADRGAGSVAVISEACIELAGVSCRACEGACPTAAISFAPRRGGGADVTIAPAHCTGCTECLPRCPVGAIAMQARALAREVIP